MLLTAAVSSDAGPACAQIVELICIWLQVMIPGKQNYSLTWAWSLPYDPVKAANDALMKSIPEDEGALLICLLTMGDQPASTRHRAASAQVTHLCAAGCTCSMGAAWRHLRQLWAVLAEQDDELTPCGCAEAGEAPAGLWDGVDMQSDPAWQQLRRTTGDPDRRGTNDTDASPADDIGRMTNGSETGEWAHPKQVSCRTWWSCSMLQQRAVVSKCSAFCDHSGYKISRHWRSSSMCAQAGGGGWGGPHALWQPQRSRAAQHQEEEDPLRGRQAQPLRGLQVGHRLSASLHQSSSVALCRAMPCMPACTLNAACSQLTVELPMQPHRRVHHAAVGRERLS